MEVAISSTPWEAAQTPDRAAAAAKPIAQPKRRWSKRQTLLFIIVVCGAFWAGVAALVMAVL